MIHFNAHFSGVVGRRCVRARSQATNQSQFNLKNWSRTPENICTIRESFTVHFGDCHWICIWMVGDDVMQQVREIEIFWETGFLSLQGVSDSEYIK